MKRIFKILSALATLLAVFGFSATAFAQGADIKSQGLASNYGLIALAAGLGIGIAALEGIARNPGAATQIRGSMILGLALIESLVIYALIIAFILAFKVGS